MAFSLETTIEKFIAGISPNIRTVSYTRDELIGEIKPVDRDAQARMINLINNPEGITGLISQITGVDKFNYYFNVLKEATLNSELRGGGVEELAVNYSNSGVVVVITQKNPWDYHDAIRVSKIHEEANKILQKTYSFKLRYNEHTKTLDITAKSQVPQEVREFLGRVAEEFGARLDGATSKELNMPKFAKRFGFELVGMGLEMFGKAKYPSGNIEITYADS